MKMKLETNLVLADDIRSKVTKDEAAAKIQTAETQEYADEAAKDLEIAMPAFFRESRNCSKDSLLRLPMYNSPLKCGD